jgi:uncharacterized protein (DUF4415 family)
MSIKRNVVMPTVEDDTQINAGIAADPDTFELSDAAFNRLTPMRGRGRPLGSGEKVQMTVRFDAEIIDTFKSTGEGWQTKMNDALKDWLKTHRVD